MLLICSRFYTVVVAQLVEPQIVVLVVVGSIPIDHPQIVKVLTLSGLLFFQAVINSVYKNLYHAQARSLFATFESAELIIADRLVKLIQHWLCKRHITPVPGLLFIALPAIHLGGVGLIEPERCSISTEPIINLFAGALLEVRRF